ncbi:MAG TPA: hypothetical protein PLC88_00990 [Syntrophomonas sp.]|nr:hypothetical protein [Syntrophomonas sp.]HRW12473.1 hypothetical protein [Syntrophomonas sp.]
MNKIFSSLLIIIVLGLVIAGLNTSSEGISSLTAEQRKPVLGLQIEKQQINIIALGEEYHLTPEGISKTGQTVLRDVRQQYCSCVDYLQKIVTIFDVLFLQ